MKNVKSIRVINIIYINLTLFMPERINFIRPDVEKPLNFQN